MLRCLSKDDDDDDLTMCWSQNAGVTVSIVSTVRPTESPGKDLCSTRSCRFCDWEARIQDSLLEEMHHLYTVQTVHVLTWFKLIQLSKTSFFQLVCNLVVLHALTNITTNLFRAGNFLRTIEEEWPGTLALDSFENQIQWSSRAEEYFDVLLWSGWLPWTWQGDMQCKKFECLIICRMFVMILSWFFMFETYKSLPIDQDYEKLAIFGTARQPFVFWKVKVWSNQNDQRISQNIR